MAMDRWYGPSAVERAMRVQEVILRAMSGEIRWIQAADILGISPRSLRRWRQRYEERGYDGLLDGRRGRPSPRRTPLAEAEKVLRLYRETYLGFNVSHFHGIAVREHGVRVSCTRARQLLQGAGLVEKRRARGRHRRRRERRECFGEMLHLDGSPHAWLAPRPDERQTLIAVLDDATSEVLYARLEGGEGTREVMTALRAVFGAHGLPQALYTDRAGWAFHTPKAGGKVDKKNRTQVGRALARLGVEHIPAYSPQARGRSERLNRTFQDRLVNELRVAGIAGVESANRYLREVFLPRHNAEFARPPADRESAFVPASAQDLDEAFCIEETRKVAPDNTVVLGRVRLQIAKQPGRSTCAGLTVVVRHRLDGSFEARWGKRVLGRYDPTGQPVAAARREGGPPLRTPSSAPVPPPANRSKRTDHLSNASGHFTC
jgi:transposase